MKQAILNICLTNIKKDNPHFSETKIDELRYGLEGIYLTLTKLVVILAITLILGIAKEFIIFCLVYNVIRCFAFGLHAKNSISCLIISSFIFVVFPYLSLVLIIPLYIKICLGVCCMASIILYAPADTYKRPLVNRKKRLKFKFLSCVITIVYIVLSLTIKNNFLANTFLLALVVEVMLILPITYKALKLPYNNYKNYHPETIN